MWSFRAGVRAGFGDIECDAPGRADGHGHPLVVAPDLVAVVIAQEVSPVDATLFPDTPQS